MSTNIARHLTVNGRVQGVFFRAAAREVAERHGVVGWAANRPDGAVEAWLEGPADAVESVQAWVSGGGPPAASVTDVEVVDVEPSDHTEFQVR